MVHGHLNLFSRIGKIQDFIRTNFAEEKYQFLEDEMSG